MHIVFTPVFAHKILAVVLLFYYILTLLKNRVMHFQTNWK